MLAEAIGMGTGAGLAACTTGGEKSVGCALAAESAVSTTAVDILLDEASGRLGAVDCLPAYCTAAVDILPVLGSAFAPLKLDMRFLSASSLAFVSSSLLLGTMLARAAALLLAELALSTLAILAANVSGTGCMLPCSSRAAERRFLPFC